MKFKIIEKEKVKPKDPESLFHDLKDRDQEIKHLWAHQADLLRDYTQKHCETKDVGLELPTGTGKTLVGLLIGEWRKVFFNERVLYLCPTRQLAYQVEKHAKEYGIKAYAFVGPQKNYSTEKFSKYSSSEVIAISTYSGLFNTNPRFNNANIIICDDAHASDNYISSLWSLNITRIGNKNLYHKIIRLFEDNLSHEFLRCVKNDNPEFYLKEQIEMIPIQYLWEKSQVLLDIITEELNKEENKALSYPWSMIYKHLLSCNIFISWWEILIRPWTPPSLTHEPFANAKQRIYMSATLRASGELERITGVPKVERLPIPAGWDKKGSGRRFFLFPDFSFKREDYLDWLLEQISKRERTLILCPDYNSLFSIENKIKKSLKHMQILKAENIENSLEPFTTQDNAILLLANRYDGLDLPDENCRQLVIYGLPAAVNLQEKFLLRRLNIYSILKNRIVTRITQACGRCTRGPNDYSLILLIGESIRDFCLKRENRLLMHPELQAEMEFGKAQSGVSKLEALDELINLFYTQGEEWQNAEENIKNLREDTEPLEESYFEKLYSIVSNEINFQYALWSKDYAEAFEIARKIGDNLSGDEFEGYRALWNYFSGSIAWILYKQKEDQEYLNIAKDFYIRAKSCSRIISWFSELPNLVDDSTSVDDIDSLSAYAIENIQGKLKKLGGVGKLFGKELNKIERLVNNDDYDKFEYGLTYLGELLGFKSKKPLGEGVPDSIWKLSDKVLFLFEAKSEESEEGGISKRSCLQAKGHYDWAQTKFPEYKYFQEKLSIIISHRNQMAKSALPFIDNLYFMHINRVREIFDEISGIINRIRSHSINSEEDKVRIKIYNELKKKNLDPFNILQELKGKPLSSLEVK